MFKKISNYYRDYKLDLKSNFIENIISLTLILIIFFLYFGSVYNGIQKNLNKVIPEAIDDQVNAISIAISELKFGADYGYLGYTVVKNNFKSGGITKDPNVLKVQKIRFPENLSNPKLIENSFKKALETNLPRNDYYSLKNRNLQSLIYADLGLVDYFKISFSLFGYNSDAPFILFYFLLFLQIIFFLIGNFKNKFYFFIPIIFLIGFNTILNSGIFNDIEVGTVFNPRFISILSVIPSFHFAMMLIDHKKIDKFQYLLLFLQSIIFFFLYFMRGSLAWIFVLLFFIIISLILIYFYKKIKPLKSIDIKKISKILIIMTVPFFFVKSFYLVKIHESYFYDDFLPHHLKFHNAYLGLAFYVPDFEKKYGDDHKLSQNDKYPRGDGISFNRTHKILIDDFKHDPNFFLSDLSGTYKMRLHDSIIKKEYFKFALNNTRDFIEAHIIKFQKLLNINKTFIQKSMNNILLSGCLITIFLILTLKNNYKVLLKMNGIFILISSILVVLSSLPLIYAYPSPRHGFEQIIFSLLFCSFISSFLYSLIIVSFNYFYINYITKKFRL